MSIQLIAFGQTYGYGQYSYIFETSEGDVPVSTGYLICNNYWDFNSVTILILQLSKLK